MNYLFGHRYIRLRPFDTSTEKGRADERYRLVALAVVTSIANRAVNVLLTLLSVSLTLPYLGVERFGIWMTVASFASMLTFLDLGIGNALTNRVSQRAAEDNPAILRQTISGGLAFLALIGLGMGLLLWLIALHLPWASVMKLEQPELLSETRQAAMTFAVLFGLSIFTGGIQRVFAGLQQAYIGHVGMAVASVAACMCLWFAARAQLGISGLLTIMLGTQAVAGLFLLWWLAAHKQFAFKSITHFGRLESPHLFKAGGLFFLLQIGTMIGWGADSLIISSTLGVAQVSVFSVVQRLFQFATQPLSILNAPLWGAYADAHARHDKAFIRYTLKHSLVITFAGAGLGALSVFIFHAWLIERWTHGSIAAPATFVAIYAAWAILESCGNSFSMFLNGTGIIRAQVVTVIFFIVLVLPMKLILIDYIGLVAVPLASVIAYLAATFSLYGIVYRKEILVNINT